MIQTNNLLSKIGYHAGHQLISSVGAPQQQIFKNQNHPQDNKRSQEKLFSERYHMIKEAGKGAFGSVFKA